MSRKTFHYSLLFTILTMALAACQASQESNPTEMPEEDIQEEATAVQEVEQDAAPVVTVDLTPVQNEPVLARGEEGQWDSDVIRFPWVVRHEGMYHMFYEARAGIGESFLAIGYATSEDGILWTKYENNPILEGDRVGFDSQIVSRPVVHVDDDGTWVMYYAGRDDENVGAIGKATALSPTGPWERSDDVLLTAGPAGAWDQELILVDQIIETESGYRLYYTGRAASGRSAMIGLATSADGLTWEKFNDPTNDATDSLFAESDPILLSGPGWDASATWTPNVLRDENGWMMIYNGGGNLGVAFSEDGLLWSKYEDNPIYNNRSLFHPFVILNDDGTYWIYYRSLIDDSIHLLSGTITFE